jgi:hypothetical protein
MSHRPDFELRYRDKGWKAANSSKVLEGYMCPYVNEEDLINPRHLLSFISSRGRIHPSCFAAADSYELLDDLYGEAAETYLSHYHMMMFEGRQALRRATRHPQDPRRWRDAFDGTWI